MEEPLEPEEPVEEPLEPEEPAELEEPVTDQPIPNAVRAGFGSGSDLPVPDSGWPLAMAIVVLLVMRRRLTRTIVGMSGRGERAA